jgi:iron complex outermembrane receptor protein
VTAYELGYRVQPNARLTLDVSLFYNNYEELLTVRPAPAPFGPLQSVAANDMEGETYGLEFSPSVQITDDLRLTGGYSLLQMNLHTRPPSIPTDATVENSSPAHQFFLRSSMDLGRNVEFDATVRYVDALSNFGIAGYVTLDLRLGWRPTKNLEFSVGAQNLLDDRHPEFYPTTIATQRTEVERSFYGKVTWQF